MSLSDERMIAQSPRDPWRAIWQVAINDVLIKTALLGIAAGLLITAWLPQRPIANPVAYAEWLSAQTGHDYRLPTEAEWEYGARAASRTPFWTGNCIHTDQANYDGDYDYNACGAKTGEYRGRTVSAGSLPAYAFGLHEVAGNVWEWV